MGERPAGGAWWARGPGVCSDCGGPAAGAFRLFPEVGPGCCSRWRPGLGWAKAEAGGGDRRGRGLLGAVVVLTSFEVSTLRGSAGGRSSVRAPSRCRSTPPDQVEAVHHFPGRDLRLDGVPGSPAGAASGCPDGRRWSCGRRALRSSAGRTTSSAVGRSRVGLRSDARGSRDRDLHYRTGRAAVHRSRGPPMQQIPHTEEPATVHPGRRAEQGIRSDRRHCPPGEFRAVTSVSGNAGAIAESRGSVAVHTVSWSRWVSPSMESE